MVEEQCQQKLKEGLIENFAEYSKGLSESSAIGVVVFPWEKNSLMLTEEGSGKDVVDEPQEHKLHLPSTDPVYPVYALPAAQPIPEEPAPAAVAKAIHSFHGRVSGINKICFLCSSYCRSQATAI